MSKFKMGDKVLLADDGGWNMPDSQKIIRDGTVGEVRGVSEVGRYTHVSAEFPGSIRKTAQAKHFLPAPAEPTPRDTRAETIAYVEGKRDAAVKLAKLAQDEAETQEKLRQKFERQVDEYNTQIDLLKGKKQFTFGATVRVVNRNSQYSDQIGVLDQDGRVTGLRGRPGHREPALAFSESELELV